MKSHDVLCPVVRDTSTQHLHNTGFLEWPVCRCEEYAKVREDEHSRHMTLIEDPSVVSKLGADSQAYVHRLLDQLRYKMSLP